MEKQPTILRWVSIKERKPNESKAYYWKGKSGYGGYNYYWVDEGFEWGDYVPSNKIDEDYLMWLEEIYEGQN